MKDTTTVHVRFAAIAPVRWLFHPLTPPSGCLKALPCLTFTRTIISWSVFKLKFRISFFKNLVSYNYTSLPFFSFFFFSLPQMMLKCKDKKWYQFWCRMSATFHRLTWTRPCSPPIRLSVRRSHRAFYTGTLPEHNVEKLFLPQFKGGTEAWTGEKEDGLGRREQTNGDLCFLPRLSVSSPSKPLKTWTSSISLFAKMFVLVGQGDSILNKEQNRKKTKYPI